MDKVPMEWVDKIFDYMGAFFGKEWTNPLEIKGRLDIVKTQWQTGLVGLNKEEIKKGLAITRCMAKNKQLPPNIIEFYFYSKGLRMPPQPSKKIDIPVNRELAKNSIAALRRLTHGYT
jgi:hypothetical protein